MKTFFFISLMLYCAHLAAQSDTIPPLPQTGLIYNEYYYAANISDEYKTTLCEPCEEHFDTIPQKKHYIFHSAKYDTIPIWTEVKAAYSVYELMGLQTGEIISSSKFATDSGIFEILAPVYQWGTDSISLEKDGKEKGIFKESYEFPYCICGSPDEYFFLYYVKIPVTYRYFSYYKEVSPALKRHYKKNGEVVTENISTKTPYFKEKTFSSIWIQQLIYKELSPLYFEEVKIPLRIDHFPARNKGTNTVLVKRNGWMSEWRKFLCSDSNENLRLWQNSPHDKNLAVQIALKKKGFYKGKCDGIWNEESQAAFDKFNKYTPICKGCFDFSDFYELEIR